MPLLKGLSDNDLLRVAGRMPERVYEDNDALIRYGERGDEMYLIRYGKVTADALVIMTRAVRCVMAYLVAPTASSTISCLSKDGVHVWAAALLYCGLRTWPACWVVLPTCTALQ